MENNLELSSVLFLTLTYFFFRHLKLPLAITSTIILLMAILSIYFPELFNNYFDPRSSAANLFTLGSLSARSLVYTIAILAIPTKIYYPGAAYRTMDLFPHLAVINSIYMLARFTLHLQPYSMGLCSSIDGMLLAIMYPTLIEYTRTMKSPLIRWTYRLLPRLAIFAAHGSIGMGGLCLGLFIMNFNLDKIKFILLPVGLFIFAYFYKQHVAGHSLFNDSLRFICWKWLMDFWWTHANHWTGFGLGTYSTLGPVIQMLTRNQIGNWYIEMHNDWLQCLFELGYIGLAAVASLVAYCTYKVRKSPVLLASIVTYSASAFFYYPTKNPIIAAFGILLIKEALDS